MNDQVHENGSDSIDGEVAEFGETFRALSPAAKLAALAEMRMVAESFQRGQGQQDD